VKTVTRIALFLGILLLAMSGLRWLLPVSQGVNIIPVLLFFFVDKESDLDALLLGGIAGVCASFLSSGPGAVWILQYFAEAWIFGRLLRNWPRQAPAQLLLIWVFMGVDFGAGLLLRMVLDYPLQTQLLKDWLVMDGMVGGCGTLILSMSQYLGNAGVARSPKRHGIGIPFS
jgi:hypothetical protein